MASVVDAWRAVDPEARLVSGSSDALARPVRGVVRTRAAPPHLPEMRPGQLLVVDATILGRSGVDGLVAALAEAQLEPSAVWVVDAASRRLDRGGDDTPVIAGDGAPSARVDQIAAYLDDEAAHLARLALQVRLAGAEAALAEPEPGAPAGAVAALLRRGAAVSVDGSLATVNARPAGLALATRFVAAHARLLADRAGPTDAPRRTRDGLWVLERAVGPAATAWLFDDLPFARVDVIALEALAVTLRALLRRRPAEPARARRGARVPPSSGNPLHDTLLAVARANGRVAPAARTLGVHRNTVLYRLRRASVELGVDPRRPPDALRLLQEADGDRG